MAVSCEVSQELPRNADHLLPALRPVDSSLAFFNNVPSLQSGQLGPHPWGKHVYYATSKYHPVRSLVANTSVVSKCVPLLGLTLLLGSVRQSQTKPQGGDSLNRVLLKGRDTVNTIIAVTLLPALKLSSGSTFNPGITKHFTGIN